ncbi:FecR domain-containing protein [Devosia sp. XGJD_8]|uniref:FecR domain-containing protein n=1 Tax=Devosia sp. XGJD_8 TaxID=3391187 RepID=UPI003984C97F
MNLSARTLAAAVVAWLALATMATADDWMVDRLRGQAMVQVDGQWRDLARGDIVDDSSPIKSLDGSRVTLVRGVERIELSGATEIRIFDRVGEKMTTVMQAYGEVTIEAERRNVQHFSVQTPYLAAIVKGTRFTVVSDDRQSNVEVSRGLVQVQDYVHEVATDIAPGQTAVVADDVALQVTGRGAKAPMVTFDGVLVSDPAPGEPGNASNNGNGRGGAGNSENTPAASKSNGTGGAGNNGKGSDGNNGNGNGVSGNGGSGNNGNGNGGGAASNNGNGGGGKSEDTPAGNSGNHGGSGNGGGAAHNNGNGSGGAGNSENPPAAGRQ